MIITYNIEYIQIDYISIAYIQKNDKKILGILKIFINT